MKKIPWPIWAAVIFGWMAAGNADHNSGPIAWFLGVGILVIAYYAEKK